MDERWVLVDQHTGLHVGWYFWLRVLDEVNRSARYGAPFALMLLEAKGEGATRRGRFADAASLIPEAIRSTDLGGLLGDGRAGVLLVEQDDAGAATAARRIIERIDEGRPADLSWETQLLCYPRDGAEITDLLTAGWDGRAGRPDAARSA